MDRWLVITSVVIAVALAGVALFYIFSSNEVGGPITCSSDEQCGGTIISDRFCREGNVYGNGQVNVCLKPGTEESMCETSYGEILVEECDEGCSQGKCS